MEHIIKWRVVRPVIINWKSKNPKPIYAYCTIHLKETDEGPELSIAGHSKDWSGQIVNEVRENKEHPGPGWTEEMVEKFCDYWDEWHLNGLRPYCSHQKALGWDKKGSQIVTLSNGETKALGWLYPREHPEGLLTKPCPVCGYKYGTAWKYEPVPQNVLDWLFNLPEDDDPLRNGEGY